MGPILFSLYVNDLPLALKIAKVLMYADDTALLYSSNSLPSLQDVISKEMAIINKWFTENRLAINTEKTQCVVLHSSRKIVNCSSLNISLANQTLNRVDSFNYLEILF